MLSRLGERIAAVFRATAPDPFVLAILLTGLAFLGSWWSAAEGSPSAMDAARGVIEAWQGPGGFWSLLAFGMQMSLILATGHALASSPVVSRALRAVSGLPRTGRQAAGLVALCACLCALLNWGMGLIVGAALARDAERALAARGRAAPPGLLAAAGYTGLMVWHGGLSGSAPLDAADGAALAAKVGPEVAAALGGEGIALRETLLSPLNLVTTGGLVVIAAVTMLLLCPRVDRPASPAAAREERRAGDEVGAWREGVVPAWLGRSPVVVWLIALPALVWLAARFRAEGSDALDLNTVNLLFLSLGLALHGSAERYAKAIEEAARGCAGILLQFPLYGGIIGMVRESGLAARVAGWFVSASGGSEAGLSIGTFGSAGLINVFVPSGGGQWAVQAPIALRAGVEAGVEPGRMVMAVAYGDQLTNMIQPFWALPLLAITGARAQQIVGYTAVVMVIAGAWIAGCLAIL